VTRLQKAEAMWAAAAGLTRMKGLAAIAHPQTAGLPQAKKKVAKATRAKAKSANKGSKNKKKR
jgi:hypothetical protein